MTDTQKRYQDVCNEVKNYTAQAQRAPESVRVLPVSKMVSAEEIARLYELGVREFGENREPVLSEKAKQLPRDICWHFIGPLQSNKIRKVIQYASVIHSIESVAQIQRIERIAGEENKKPTILIEVNISGETQKGGCAPEKLPELVAEASRCENLKLAGLMTMAPLNATESELMAIFGKLKELRDDLENQQNLRLPELSMGMSGDYHEAIKCGATIVRIGTAIFGEKK